MKVNTLFPSSSNNNGQVKGGITLLKLKKNNKNNINLANLELSVKYKDRNNKYYENKLSVIFNGNNKNNKNNKENKYDNNGIRKAIVLSRYVELIKEWINYENRGKNKDKYNDNGLSKWERRSTKLNVNEDYKQKFNQFKQYFVKEMKELNDETLQKEVYIIEKLAK